MHSERGVGVGVVRRGHGWVTIYAAATSGFNRMIESTYWRQELRAEVLWLKPRPD